MRTVLRSGYHYFTAALTALCLLAAALAGCGSSSSGTAPAAESASEDMTEAAREAFTEEAPAAEEAPKITTETAGVGICLAESAYGDNERLAGELQAALVRRGFLPENIYVTDMMKSRSRQEEAVSECLSQGCALVIISAVDDARIPGLADMIHEAGAGAVFVNCTPGGEETARWDAEQIPAVWIGTTSAEVLACQMNILFDCSGQERGIDFNGDGHVGAFLIGGGEEAREQLEETVRDLGSELQILGETDSVNEEEISSFTQEILNERKKEVELILCSTEERAQAAADGVQLRHRLVGRDILVIGTGAHEDTCTAIINKLMSGSVFTDFYEQANLTAVAAKDLIEGNQAGGTISAVIFKVTEDNAQEVLDQLWRTRPEQEEEKEEEEEEESGSGDAEDTDGADDA